jgi:hypothetical protein
LARFLEIHGHRGLAEVDVASRTWRQDRRQVVRLLRAEIAAFEGDGHLSRGEFSSVDIDPGGLGKLSCLVRSCEGRRAPACCPARRMHVPEIAARRGKPMQFRLLSRACVLKSRLKS